MKSFFRILLGAGLLALGVGFAGFLVATKPEAERKAQTDRRIPLVKFIPVSYGPMQLTLPSQGLIDASQRTQLSAEVAGQVIEVSPKFKAGGEFAEGEVLLKIDPADYNSALAQAEANLADARLALATEEAKAEQALRDWKSLGRSGLPGDLTQRKPQLASARAAIRSAEEGIEKAKRDVERTEVTAPFAGRLAATEVEEGAYLGPGTRVAEIFSTAPWEIRLPLALDDWEFLQRDESGNAVGEVSLLAQVGNQSRAWKGELIRTEGEVDRSSRSIYLVAKVPGDDSDSLIQPGLFVQARISGKTEERVARIPFRAFVSIDQVAIIDAQETIRKKTVKILRREGDEVLISGGLEEGDRVCLTQLADMVEGMQVNPEEEEKPAIFPADTGQVATRP